MGYSISWIAIRNKAEETVLGELGLSATGQFAGWEDAPVSGRAMPDGWYLVVFDQCDARQLGEESLASISRNCEVVACSVEEHVMYCSAAFWKDGEQVWRVEHDAQRSIDHLEASGRLPDDYASIERQYAAEQDSAGGKNADTDWFFEIPLQLARNAVEFKHDESEFDEDSFEILKQERISSRAVSASVSDSGPPIASAPSNPPAPKRKPWWQFW